MVIKLALTTIHTTIGMAITNGTNTRVFTIRTPATTLQTNITKEPDGVLKLVILLQSSIQILILKVHITTMIPWDGDMVAKATGTI